MSDSKHTPGPWWVSNGALLRVSAQDAVICGVHQIGKLGGKGKGDPNANARLIAAAPELLAALNGMLEWARRVKEKNPGMEVVNACIAIAKATDSPQSLAQDNTISDTELAGAGGLK